MDEAPRHVADRGAAPWQVPPRIRRLPAQPAVLLPALRDAWQGLRRGLAMARPAPDRVVRFEPEHAAGQPALVARPRLSPTLDIDGLPPGSAASEWTTIVLVRALLERGHPVDVVDEHAIGSACRSQYGIFIGGARALAVVEPGLPASCRRVLHFDGADPLFQNAAELSRLVQLRDRRGVVLPPVRHEVRAPSYEKVVAAIAVGNQATLETFAGCPVPVYPVPRAPVRQDRPPPDGKDFARARQRFLWLGGGGLVHQGLDRVLEAFAALTDVHLTVVAPLAAEPRFARAYAPELHGAPNIEVLGDLPLDDPRLDALAQRCAGLVLPTAAEGQSPEVVEGLSLGLIPIVSREAGVDVEGFGLELKTCSREEIQDAIRTVADLTPDDLAARAHLAWKSARERHDRDVVARAYRAALDRILTS